MSHHVVAVEWQRGLGYEVLYLYHVVLGGEVMDMMMVNLSRWGKV